MTVVAYPDFRAYQRQRIETNDAMMGLLAGSKLASQVLALTDGAKRPLSEIFPSIDHIERFNLRSDLAQEVLNHAEELLGVLAVPQVLALHEHLFTQMLDLATSSNKQVFKNLNMSNVHEKFEEQVSTSFSPEALELFHYLRVARNSHIHTGGYATKTLVAKSTSLSADAELMWSRVAGSPPRRYSLGDPVHIRIEELKAALALTKRLADAANIGLQSFLSTEAWAATLIRDWASTPKRGNRQQLLRNVRGFAKMHGYPALKLPESVLDDALDSYIEEKRALYH